jgi:hypothetical protein
LVLRSRSLLVRDQARGIGRDALIHGQLRRNPGADGEKCKGSRRGPADRLAAIGACPRCFHVGACFRRQLVGVLGYDAFGLGERQASRQKQLAATLAGLPFAAAFIHLGSDAVEVRTFRHDRACSAPVLQHALMREADLRMGVRAAGRQQPRRNQRIDQPARRRIGRCLRKWRRADGEGGDLSSSLSRTVLAIGEHSELSQEPRQTSLLRLAESRERGLSGFLDDAFEPSQPFINLERQAYLAVRGLAALEQTAERELYQRKHVGPLGLAQQPRIQSLSGQRILLVDEPGRLGRAADDLGELDRTGRCQIVGGSDFLELLEAWLIEHARVEVRPQCHHHPDTPGRGQGSEQIDEARTFVFAHRGCKKLIKLIDQQHEVAAYAPGVVLSIMLTRGDARQGIDDRFDRCGISVT